MGLSLMQWRIAMGVHFYCKVYILRTLLVFDSSHFCHIFLFVLNCVFQMFLGTCFTIRNMFKKPLNL